MLRPQNGRTRFVTQDEYDKSLISPSHQKLAGDVLQKDDKRMKFQLKARWMRTTALPGRIRNSLSASSRIRHLNVRFGRV